MDNKSNQLDKYSQKIISPKIFFSRFAGDLKLVLDPFIIVMFSTPEKGASFYDSLINEAIKLNKNQFEKSINCLGCESHGQFKKLARALTALPSCYASLSSLHAFSFFHRMLLRGTSKIL